MKKRHILVLLLAAPIFIIIGDKYVANGALRRELTQRLGNVVTALKAGQGEDTTAQIPCNTVSNTYNFTLKQKDGDWALEAQADSNRSIVLANPSSASDATANDFYRVDTSSQQLKLIPAHPEKICNFDAQIDGVDSYYSIANTVSTDIPSSLMHHNFNVYEQEDFLPIFGYHFVAPNNQSTGNPLEISLTNFITQVEYATNVMGCRWYTFGDIMQNYVIPQKKTPKRACVMTFDDGHRDNYEVAFPVLKHYGIKATFYIITGRVGATSLYMNWAMLDELYKDGQEIGAHTVTHNGQILAGDDHAQIVYEIDHSKETLEEHGYNITTFAYPLGVWNDDAVNTIKAANFIGARAIEKSDHWRDKRPLTISTDPDFIWHMYYHRPDRYLDLPRAETPEELNAALGYNNWWQFEEGYAVISGKPILRNSYHPTDNSFVTVELDEDASISNKLIVSNQGLYTIDVFGSTVSRDHVAFPYADSDLLKISVDGVQSTQIRFDNKSCVPTGKDYFCDFLVDVKLDPGVHTLTVGSAGGVVIADKFRLYRTMGVADTYNVKITEYGLLK